MASDSRSGGRKCSKSKAKSCGGKSPPLTDGSSALQHAPAPFQELFLESNLGVCIKDSENRVVFQNHACLEICADQMANACEEGCMKMYQFDRLMPHASEGVQFFPNEPMDDGKRYDVILMKTKENLLTLFMPLEEKHLKSEDLFLAAGLSDREFEIAQEVTQGASNKEISEKFEIAPATTRRHLANIYRKFPGLKALARHRDK